MKAAIAIEPVTVFKTRSAQLINKARSARQPIFITQNGKATAVLQDVESYEKQRQTLMLLKLMAQGDQQIKHCETVDHTKARKHFVNRLQELQHA